MFVMRTARKLLAALLVLSLFAVSAPVALAYAYTGYTPLDASSPIAFDGATVTWNGKTFTLDENTIYLDYRLDSAQIADHPYAFNNIQDAAAALRDGTAEKPMLLLTAPGVYWVDDPDDPEIRIDPNGGTPYGMVIDCDYLYFYGLNTVADNVVFACNRGQTQGASGNFTLFNIKGKGLKSENVTFGNYCNVDLEFPLDPAQGREKRAEAIAQAQLFSYNSQDGVAINTNFISRLNLCPFAVTYLNCHLESSGHASFFNSVYIGCSLEFYNVNFSSGKFFDCDIYLTPFTHNYQGLTNYYFGFVDGTGSGTVCVDTRFHRSQELKDLGITAEIAWDKKEAQSPTTRGYQHNVTLDGAPYVIQPGVDGASVQIPEDSMLLKAYKVTGADGQVYYNVPNILGMDPYGYTPAIRAAAQNDGLAQDAYLNIPLAATLAFSRGSASTIRSGQTTTNLTYGVSPAGKAGSAAIGAWTFTASQPDLVEITDNGDGTITVAGKNDTEQPVDVILIAKNALGVEAAAKLTVEPSYVDAPTFVSEPKITGPFYGQMQLSYQLDLGGDARRDESLVTWYRCDDAQGGNPLKVAVSRLDEPENAYTLGMGDVGHYLMATIAPKHNRCDAGELVTVYSDMQIQEYQVLPEHINTNFQNFPTDPQTQILPGTWTVDGYFAPECIDGNGVPRYNAVEDSWTYAAGSSGSLGYYGLDEKARGARLFYTPAHQNSDNMAVRVKLAPDKTAGQGFGSATDQFLELYIKYDLATQTGYALRIQRMTPDEINAIGYNGDGSVAGCAFWLVAYENGVRTDLTEKIMSSAFLTECTAALSVKDGVFEAKVTSTAETRSGDLYDYPREVQLKAAVADNEFGGTGMLFTGTVGSNSVLVLNWQTAWGPNPVIDEGEAEPPVQPEPPESSGNAPSTAPEQEQVFTQTVVARQDIVLADEPVLPQGVTAACEDGVVVLRAPAGVALDLTKILAGADSRSVLATRLGGSSSEGIVAISGSTVQTLQSGTVFLSIQIGQRSGFIKVVVGDGGPAPQTPAAAAPVREYTVTASRLNIRSGPGTQYAILGTLSRGTVFACPSSTEGWLQLDLGGIAGYISMQYVK